MTLFDLKRPSPTPKKKTATRRFENSLEGKSASTITRFESTQTARVAIIEKHLRIPIPGESIFVWTTNQFNTMAFILWPIKHLGAIQSLTISTYSIGSKSINTIMRRYDSGDIKEIYFYVATYAKRINTKNTDLLLAQANARTGVNVGFGFNHSKVLLARTAYDYITICGSGNFSENAYNEQYTICNDKKIYEFYYSAIRSDNAE